MRVHVPSRGAAGRHRHSSSDIIMEALHLAFSSPAMRAQWRDEAVLAAMLHVEAMLADAQAACGVIPRAAADVIAQACAELRPDAQALALEAHRAGTLAIPLVKALKADVAARDAAAAPYVHVGSTSQDVADTALVMLAQTSLQLLSDDLRRLGDGLAALVTRHANTGMLARTLLQPAAPISFGWKAAGWLDAIGRSAVALRQAGEAARVLQFGGANGTLATHGEAATAVAQALALRLRLQMPAISWHGGRDRLARLGGELAIVCGTLGKLARDVSLLMQSEVGEVFEPEGAGRGGSSAMPHKRNPVGCMHMLDAAYRTPALAMTLVGELPSEHERGLGSWPNALPVLGDLFALTANGVAAAVEVVEGLRVEPDAMLANLGRLHGIVYSEGVSSLLTRKLGPDAAQRIVAEASAQAVRDRTDLGTLLKRHAQVRAVLDSEEIDAVCSLSAQLAATQPMCARVLSQWQVQRASLIQASLTPSTEI
jgi:3-carboxy-cis,cis-muconate cycloisomerase